MAKKIKKPKTPKVPKDITPLEHLAERDADKLVRVILDNAGKNAKTVLDNAQQNVRDNLDAEAFKLDAYAAEVVRRAENAAAETLRHRLMLAEMDSKKADGKARQDLLDSVFTAAEREILALPDAKYLEFLRAVIERYAEDGDEVIAAADDRKRVTADFVKKAGDAAKKKLKLSGEAGAFSGGIILRSLGYDKNFTVAAIIRELRTEVEAGVSGILFGGEKRV